VFWSSLAYTLIGGTIGGTVLTLVFLPALYADVVPDQRLRLRGPFEAFRA
jgi:Cu/Ag efflux pump CusA